MMETSTIIWGLVFGSIGLGFFIYGKKQSAIIPLLCGIGLMLIPYLIGNIYLLIFAGIVLLVLPYFIRT